MLETLTTLTVFHAILLFARVGSIVMLLPGFGEANYSLQARLLLSLALSLVLLPILSPLLPALPGSAVALAILIAGEVIVGVFIGAMTRVILGTLHSAGMIISFQMGLSAAMLFDPSQGSQGSIVGNFLSLVAFVLIFATDLHHIFIYGMVDSYTIFVPSEPLPWGDFAEYAGKLASETFAMAFRLSAPMVVAGLLVYLAAGVMSRLMPQMQVFFVLIPLQVLIGILILMVTLSGGMMWYMDYVAETYGNLLIP